MDAEEDAYGVPSLNYALGWYTLDMDAKTGLLWDPGGNTGFIAQAFKYGVKFALDPIFQAVVPQDT